MVGKRVRGVGANEKCSVKPEERKGRLSQEGRNAAGARRWGAAWAPAERLRRQGKVEAHDDTAGRPRHIRIARGWTLAR